MFGNTWLSLTPPISDADTAAAMDRAGFIFERPFGSALGYYLVGWFTFAEQLYPRPKVYTSLTLPNIGGATPLNPNAPEAAVRLQRVGATDPLHRVGRMCFPITEDAWYTDLPHRRQLDLAHLNALLVLNSNLEYRQQTRSGRVYTNVIYHRSSRTWHPVTSFRVMANPVRLWQRWRAYDYSSRVVADRWWLPNWHSR